MLQLALTCLKVHMRSGVVSIWLLDCASHNSAPFIAKTELVFAGVFDGFASVLSGVVAPFCVLGIEICKLRCQSLGAYEPL